MHHIMIRLGDLFGTHLEPSQKNLLALVISTLIYVLFINRSK